MKAKILIVDDEAIILMSWEKALKSAGYEVTTALNGKEAIEIVHDHKPDIVITDLIMPEMDGVELCRRILKINPQTKVVLLSGYSEMLRIKRDFINAGGRDVFLTKPLYEDDIIAAVEKIIKEKT
jgi:YesN/AraC family two-component response regulator